MTHDFSCRERKILSLSVETHFYSLHFRSIFCKRTASSKVDASVLKESLAAPLSPMPELSTGTGDLSNVGVTPIQKKKMKLYKQTPQLSEVIAVTCQHKSVLHLKFSFLF